MKTLIASLVVSLAVLSGCGADESNGSAKTEFLTPISKTTSASNFNLKITRVLSQGAGESNQPTTEEQIASAVVEALLPKPENLVNVINAEFANRIEVSEGTFVSEVEAFFFMKALEKDLDSVCGRDNEGFTNIFYCGDIQILRAGNKVAIIKSKEIYFDRVTGNHEISFKSWEKGSETSVKIYLPLYPEPQ